MTEADEIWIGVNEEHFRLFLEVRGITLRKLCRDLNMNRSYLYECLRKGRITLAKVTDICEYLDAPIRMVFGPEVDLTATYDYIRRIQNVVYRK